MQVVTIDHFNLRAERALLDQLRDFYVDIVGLRDGERPGFSSFGYWLYAGEQAVLHLSEARADEQCARFVSGTFNHVSFHCRDRAGYENRLQQASLDYRLAQVPDSGIYQIFLADPAGNGVELIFPD